MLNANAQSHADQHTPVYSVTQAIFSNHLLV